MTSEELKNLTREDFFKIVKEQLIIDLLKWIDKERYYYNRYGIHNPGIIREIKEIRNTYYFLVWKE